MPIRSPSRLSFAAHRLERSKRHRDLPFINHMNSFTAFLLSRTRDVVATPDTARSDHRGGAANAGYWKPLGIAKQDRRQRIIHIAITAACHRPSLLERCPRDQHVWPAKSSGWTHASSAYEASALDRLWRASDASFGEFRVIPSDGDGGENVRSPPDIASRSRIPRSSGRPTASAIRTAF